MSDKKVTALGRFYGVREPLLADGAALLDIRYYEPEVKVVLGVAEMDKLVEWWREHRPAAGELAEGEEAPVETCYYCGAQYHPMPRYTKGGQLRYVCSGHYAIREDGEPEWVETDCRQRAEKDGFTYRPDLTPER